MSIYAKAEIEKSARAAAAQYVQGVDAICPFPDSHAAATVWRDALAAEVDRLREEVAA